MDTLTTGLNPEQLAAVTTNHPRVLCIAGAGTGKTSVLTRRVARLLHEGVDPDRILAVTFTRAAAAEMRDRVAELMPEGWKGMPHIHTLHSWGAKIIRRCAAMFGLESTFTVYDEQDMADVRKLAEELVGATTSKLRRDRRDAIDRMYSELLRKANAVDFDMIEAYTLQAIKEFPQARRLWIEHYRHVMVDEYQDTNLSQHAIVEALFPPNLFVVGDPRQSIYAFRGAEPATIVGLAERADFEVIHLTTNYRSETQIVAAGNAVQGGPWKAMEARPGAQAGRVQTTDHDPVAVVGGLAETYGLGNVAVLARTWRRLRALHRALTVPATALHRALTVPATIYDRSTDPWDHEDGKGLARALRLTLHPFDDNLAMWVAAWFGMPWPEIKAHRAMAGHQHLFQYLAQRDPVHMGPMYTLMIANTPSILGITQRMDPHELALMVLATGKVDDLRKRGLTTRVERLEGLVKDLRRHSARDGRWWVDETPPMQRFQDWWSARSVAMRLREAESKDTVHLMTLHAAKGLEWDAVVLLGMNEGSIPQLRTDSDPDEERRLAYVGVTRARQELVLCVDPWEPPSRYLDDILNT